LDNEQLQYRQKDPISREDALRVLRSGDSAAVADALFRLALYCPDAKWVEELCLKYVDSPDDELRCMSALSLGTLARIHGAAFDGRRTFNRLLALVEDHTRDRSREVLGNAEDALSDLQIFRFDEDSYSRERMLPLLRSNDVWNQYCAIFHVARHDSEAAFAWVWCDRFLKETNYALRVAALWATADIWERLDRCFQIDAAAQVLRLFADSNQWVREVAHRVEKIIAPRC